MLGYAIATQVCTAEEDYTSSDQGEGLTLNGTPLIERVGLFCRELVVMADLMTYARQLLG